MAKRPPPDLWDSARLLWESDPTQTFDSVARWMAENGCAVTRVAVSKRAKRKGDEWARPESLRDINQAAQRRADAREVAAKVSADAAKVAAETRAEAAADEATDVRAEVLVRHRGDWASHREHFKLEAISKDFNLGKSAKISAEMLMLRQKGERMAYGITDDDGGSSDFEKTLAEIHAATGT